MSDAACPHCGAPAWKNDSPGRDSDWVCGSFLVCCEVVGDAHSVHQSSICMERQIKQLQQRIAQLSSYLDQTADGKLVCETDAFYCPKCSGRCEVRFDVAYCWNCKNPDDGSTHTTPPLPLLLESTYADPTNVPKGNK